jgi:hypothetical protein
VKKDLTAEAAPAMMTLYLKSKPRAAEVYSMETISPSVTPLDYALLRINNSPLHLLRSKSIMADSASIADSVPRNTESSEISRTS